MRGNIKKAILHLKKEKILKELIKNHSIPVLNKGDDYFVSLVRSIIYQQLSGKAAGTILGRFKNLFKRKKLDAKGILKLKDEHFKSAGISGQKMKYLRDLSSKFLDKKIDLNNFDKMKDEEIREHLILVKGIGRWTADMFLIFTLNRLDVMPTGDLAIQKGFKDIFKLKKIPDDKKMLRLSKNWAPYRTIASLYLWKLADNSKK